MYSEPKHFRKFKNQLNYVSGQMRALHLYLEAQRSNDKILHLVQTLNGGTAKLLKLIKKALCERVYTLTNTLLDRKNLDDETRAKVLAARKSAASMQDVKLPELIIWLQELEKLSGSESAK